MLRAAHGAFCERGFVGTTMDVIAEGAGVAVQTLYFTFHTKAALLEETVGAAILGFERWDPKLGAIVVATPRQAFAEFHPWFPAFERSQTAAEALAGFVDSTLDILQRVAPLVLVMSAAAGSDEQVERAVKLAEERRVDGYAFVVELMARRFKLRRGVSQRRATDILLTILSAETYHQLADRRGWSVADCRKWFLQLLEQQLLEPRAAPSRQRKAPR
jgi:AcrR family transcriptional regulator